MIRGKVVYLTTIEESDLEQLRLWRNQEEYRKYFREYREISKAMQQRWFNEQVNNNDKVIMFAIRSVKDDRLLGCCGVCYINWIHRHADLSLYIGEDNKYIDEKGLAEESCGLLFNYAFGELGLHKIWTEIYEFDEPKLQLYQKVGLKKDGELRDNYFYEGRWWNSYILSILAQEYYEIRG